eukprot:s2013_g12.t1
MRVVAWLFLSWTLFERRSDPFFGRKKARQRQNCSFGKTRYSQQTGPDLELEEPFPGSDLNPYHTVYFSVHRLLDLKSVQLLVTSGIEVATVCRMSWYVDEDGARTWINRDSTVFTVVVSDKQLPLEQLTYLAVSSKKAVYQEAICEDEPSDTASFAAFAGREAPASAADSAEFAAADRTDPEPEAFPSESPSARLLRPAHPFVFPRSDSFELPVIEFSRDFEVAILSCREPERLACLVPSFLDSYTREPALHSSDPLWSPAARVGRALRAGISARRVLTGQFHRQARSPELLSIANHVYVCLHCIRSETGWWTTSYELYWGFIADPDTDEDRFQACSAAPITHRPLSFDEVQRLGVSSASSKVLPTLCLVSHAGEPPEEVRILGYLVRCRTNGFMVILPGLTTVQSVLDSLLSDLGSEQLVYKLEEAHLEDSRGRKFGKGSVYLVDFSAECALFFSRAPALRGAAASGIQRLKVGDAVARPAAKAAWQMSEAWIAELAGEDEAIQEYFTAESDFPGAAQEEQSPAGTYGPGTPDEAVERLEAQVQDLREQLARASQAQRQVPPSAKADPHRGVAAPATLFSAPSASLDASTLQQLKQLAGPAPGRLSRLEEERKHVQADHPSSAAQDQFAELQAGVLEDDELAAVITQSQDPLHQILALQLKQTAALTQRLSSQVPDHRRAGQRARKLRQQRRGGRPNEAVHGTPDSFGGSEDADLYRSVQEDKDPKDDASTKKPGGKGKKKGKEKKDGDSEAAS